MTPHTLSKQLKTKNLNKTSSSVQKLHIVSLGLLENWPDESISHVPCSHQTVVFHIPFRTKVTILIHLHAYMSHAHGDMITFYVHFLWASIRFLDQCGTSISR